MPIHADEALLQRLTMNLLDNAIKYTPAGGNVQVACESTGAEYKLTVRDNGPGISAVDVSPGGSISAARGGLRSIPSSTRGGAGASSIDSDASLAGATK